MSDLRLREAASSATPTSSTLEEIWAQMFSQLASQSSESTVSGTGLPVLSAMEEATGSVRYVPVVQTTMETVFRTTTASVTVSYGPAITGLPLSSETFSSLAPAASQDISNSTLPSGSLNSTLSPANATTSRPQSRPLFTLATTSSETTSYTPVPPGVLSFDPTTSASTSAYETSLMSVPEPTMPADQSSSSSSGLSPSSKRAIVGSLAGAIGGLILIGILMCIFLRRRHKLQEVEDAPKDELKEPKPPRYHMVRKWSDFTLQTQRSIPEIPQGSQPSAVDGSLIRVSTDYWKRPFAKDSGMREALAPAPLRIANPDNPKSTSQAPGAAPIDPRKQHPAFRTFIHTRSRTASRNAVPPIKPAPVAYPAPAHADPAKSRNAAIRTVQPSNHSSSSSNTQPFVRPHPLDDPFVSSNKKNRYSPPSASSSPSIQKAKRSISRLSNTINPLRNKVLPYDSLPPFQGYVAPDMGIWDLQRGSSGSMYSSSSPQCAPVAIPDESSDRSSKHTPKKSDPFNLLISPGTRDLSTTLADRMKEDERAQKIKKASGSGSSPNWQVYKGT